MHTPFLASRLAVHLSELTARPSVLTSAFDLAGVYLGIRFWRATAAWSKESEREYRLELNQQPRPLSRIVQAT